MAGILDSKQRIMDIFITDEGRAQAAAGEFTLRYATFTDRHAFYDTDNPLDARPVTNDATSRIYFECTSRHQDQIVVELLPGGAVKPFRSADFNLAPAGEEIASNELTGSNAILQSAAVEFIEDITKSFYQQEIIGTIDPFSDTTDFRLSTDTNSPTGSVKFSLTDERPFRQGDVTTIPLENIESIFQDKRFSHLPNFTYLPPRNKAPLGSSSGPLLGNYVNWCQRAPVTLQELLQDLEGKEFQEIEFVETSRENNLVIQPFEFIDSGGIRKLCIVDYGEFPDEDIASPGKRVFFVGRLLKDSNGFDTFVNIFTVIMD